MDRRTEFEGSGYKPHSFIESSNKKDLSDLI